MVLCPKMNLFHLQAASQGRYSRRKMHSVYPCVYRHSIDVTIIKPLFLLWIKCMNACVNCFLRYDTCCLFLIFLARLLNQGQRWLGGLESRGAQSFCPASSRSLNVSLPASVSSGSIGIFYTQPTTIIVNCWNLFSVFENIFSAWATRKARPGNRTGLWC